MEEIGKVAEMYIYPVKSFRAVPVTHRFVERAGLENDRRLMLVDAEGKFISQRTVPRMATMRADWDGNTLVLQSPNSSGRFTRAEYGPTVQTRIWNSEVLANEFSLQASQWISDRLGQSCRLVEFGKESKRLPNQSFAGPNDQVAFQDGFPILLTSSGSLKSLNSTLSQPLEMNRFRPNIVVECEVAWEEHSWSMLKIGAASFKNVKPCGRCLVITTDQTTGERGSSAPLTMLSELNGSENAANFGINLIPFVEGTVTVGDSVFVSRTD